MLPTISIRNAVVCNVEYIGCTISLLLLCVYRCGLVLHRYTTGLHEVRMLCLHSHKPKAPRAVLTANVSNTVFMFCLNDSKLVLNLL